MTVVEGVQVEGPREVLVDELGPDVKLGEAVIHAQILNERGEPFVEPQVGPPLLHNTHTDIRYSVGWLQPVPIDVYACIHGRLLDGLVSTEILLSSSAHLVQYCTVRTHALHQWHPWTNNHSSRRTAY